MKGRPAGPAPHPPPAASSRHLACALRAGGGCAPGGEGGAVPTARGTRGRLGGGRAGVAGGKGARVLGRASEVGRGSGWGLAGTWVGREALELRPGGSPSLLGVRGKGLGAGTVQDRRRVDD